MKRTRLTFSVFFLGIAVAVAADTPPALDQTPLPPGPILKRAPDVAEWQIAYTYASPKPAPDASSSAATIDPANAPGSHLPKLVTVTQTKPIWHVVTVDVSGQKVESWFDGATRFEVGPKESNFMVISPNAAVSAQSLRSYYNGGTDFPDVAWVSADNYLGIQKGTTYWVFQQEGNGAMVWINSSTHYPVRWQKDRETRTFQFLPEPAEKLTLPPNLAKISKDLKHLDDLNHSAPPHL